MVYAITQFMTGSIESLTQRCLVDLKEKTVSVRPTAASGQIKSITLQMRCKKLRSKILALALTTPRRFWRWPMYDKGAADVAERLLAFAVPLLAC